MGQSLFIFLRSIQFKVLVLGLAIFSCTFTLWHTGALEWLELGAYDFFVSIQPKSPAVHSRIVVIVIGDKDIQELGSWPLSDEVLANVLQILTRSRPRAIGFDIFRDIPVSPGSDELDAIFRQNSNIITVTKFGDGGIGPPNCLKGTEQVGFNDIMVDPGGTVRRGLLFLDDGERVSFSFALRLSLLYLRAEHISPKPDPMNPEHLHLGPHTIRPFESGGGYVHCDTRGYQYLLDFKESPSSFPVFSITELLSEQIDPAVFTDKIVLIGTSAHSVKDFFYTPYSRGLDPDTQVPGVVVHAHAISQIIRIGKGETAPIGALGRVYEVLLILASCLAGSFLGMIARSPVRLAALACTGPIVLTLIAYIAFVNGLWITLVPPTGGLLASASLAIAYFSKHERRQRAVLMKMFSSHVSPQVAEMLWSQRDQLLEHGRPKCHKVTATILFSDLKGFSGIAEKMDPLVLMDWLNRYMETMTHLVMEYGGMVDDYAGDGLKANFGLPVPCTTQEEIRRDAVNAVRCALAMVNRMEELNDFWQRENSPTVGLRIGVCTGQVVAGTIGSVERQKYTTLGNIVNTASRLESYDKKLMMRGPTGTACRILISESTFRYIDGCFHTVKIGEATLSGQDKKTAIYSVLDCLGSSLDCTEELK